MRETIESPQIRRAAAVPLSADAERLYALGARELRAGRYAEARDAFAEGAELAPRHAPTRSGLGLSLAYVDRDFERARTLCESAAKQEFFNPDAYLNLARVYLVFGRRAEAMRYLRRGKMIDPGNAAIRSELASLGRRQIPVVPFLPRRHPVNRALGGARQIIRTNFFGRLAA